MLDTLGVVSKYYSGMLDILGVVSKYYSGIVVYDYFNGKKKLHLYITC
jgi:hypothetical protein